MIDSISSRPAGAIKINGLHGPECAPAGRFPSRPENRHEDVTVTVTRDEGVRGSNPRVGFSNQVERAAAYTPVR